MQMLASFRWYYTERVGTLAIEMDLFLSLTHELLDGAEEALPWSPYVQRFLKKLRDMYPG